MIRPHRVQHVLGGLGLVATLGACADRAPAETWEDWYTPGEGTDVTEPVAFTEDPYDLPESGSGGIRGLRTALLTQVFDNDGPIFAAQDFPADATACGFWEPELDPADTDVVGTLPAEITGYVTSHPRVYRKIEGCAPDGAQSDEKYYGSYFLEDRTGGIFVLRDSKVAPFDIGARVTLRVRAVRRRFGVDMVYVHDLVEAEPGPFPLSYAPVTRPLTADDQSTVVRFTGTVVTEPTTFGETLLTIDGYTGGTCAPDTRDTRAHCAVIQLDQEITRRGVTLAPGERVTVTGPVASSPFFDAIGVINFYGPYITRVGQITRLDTPVE